ncbi:MAG TPA: TonB-dependent receptor [Caulobacteraceae bacterium]|nr:TonB-dependent receptor [Caulobacteraceae bacterium]
MKRALLCGGSMLAAALGLCASPAIAADATAEASATAPGVVEELTVVAQKREEKIESVPVAITAFSAKERDVIGLRTVQEISDFTPGLSYYAIADRAYIRGIGRNTVNLATAAGVAIYYNGIYYGANGSVSLQHDSLFIGNIEVDRGPQNTLHGSNSDGGTINYIEKRPTRSFYAEGRLGIQQYGYYTGEAVVSGPISDNWRVRAGGQYAFQNDGFFHNLIGPNEGGVGPQGNGGRWYYFEGQIEGTIGEHLDVWGMASTGDFDTNFHTVATKGNIPELPNLSAGAGGLYPSDFYGLCAVNSATHPECGPGGVVGSVVPGSATGPLLASSFPGNNPSNLNLHDYMESSTQHNTENKNLALATTWTYHLPSLDIEYLGGYQTFYYNLMFGPGIDSGLTSYQIQGPAGLGNATVFPSAAHTLFIEDDTSFSNEINFISTGASPFQYLLGFYQFHEKFQQPIGAGCTPFQPQVYAPQALLGGPAPANPDGCFFNQNGLISYNDVAGFAHGSYKFNDQFNIAGGIRYTWDHREGIETQRLINFTGTGGVNSTSTDLTRFLDAGLLGGLPAAFVLPCGTPAPGATPAGAGPASINCATGNIQRSLSASWSAVTGDVTLNWTPDPSMLAYFRYARGYKAGGFAAGTFEGNAAQGVASFTQPEFVDSYEIGLKKTLGSTLTANLAAFYYNFANDQQPLGVVQPGGVVVTQLFNIPAAREYGVELEGVWRPIDPLTLSLQYSYLSAKVSSMNGKCVVDSADPNGVLPGENHNCPAGSPVGAQNIVGATLPEAPPNKVSINGQYVFNFDPGKLTLSVSAVWKDRTYGEIFNSPLNLAPSYYTVNLRAVWDDAQDRYTIIGFINNVSSTLGYDNVTQTRLGPGTNLANLALVQGIGLTAPLVVGGEIQFRFK